MRLSVRVRSEDLLIGALITFSILFPFFIAFLIWYEDYCKERGYMRALHSLALIISGNKDCEGAYKEEVWEILGEDIKPEDIKRMCVKNKGSLIKDSRMERKDGKLTYTLLFGKDRNGWRELRIKARVSDDEIKVVRVYIDNEGVLP